MPLVSGATAAGFNIVRPLGGGQIGELYVAEHPRLPRQYALKILSADLSADPEYRFRFHQESDRAAALSHPNIVGLHDRGEFEDQLWLAMDYVDGTDAAQLLTDTYPDGMPPEMVIEIVSAVADALDYAHGQGLVHGYVNPSNILVSDSASGRRRISLAGFGVARRSDETNSLTRANLAIGTVSYTAPEQLLDDTIDGQADQYALACTAFHLLTGWPPFAHMNPAVVISKHLNDASPRPSDVKPELIYFDAPFARALMKAPAERFPQCREFAKALEGRANLKSLLPNAKAASLPNGAEIDNEPAAAPSTAAVTSAPPADEVGEAAAPPDALPAEQFDDPPPDVLPEPEVDDPVALAESDVWSAAPDDTSRASRRRRLLQMTALGLTILAVALAGIFGVIALRSASRPDETPTNVDTLSSVTSSVTSAVTTTPPPPPAPATAIPPPIVKTPTAKPTAPPTVTASRAATVAPTTTASSAPQTTARHTTSAPSSPATTTPSGLDTRPAVGVPCGAPGATATSNAGAPVVCADTPGGAAWEPPGG